MKKTPLLIGSAVALTLVLYLLVYFRLPGDPPTAGMVALFAGISIALVWSVNYFVGKKHPGKSGKNLPLLVALFLTAGMLSCHRARPNQQSVPLATAMPPPLPPAPPAPASPRREPVRTSPGMARVTGTAFLVGTDAEQPGFGLYSYALFSHPPTAEELPRYRAFLQAFLALPTASGLARYVVKQRINITMLPLTSVPDSWSALSVDAQIDYVLAHYNYERSTVILASLPQRSGPGPEIVSVLTPIDPSSQPRPVLMQDLSKAQPDLMTSYLSQFVAQVGKDVFWKPDTLSSLSLGLKNVLEVAAVGLGMSQTAVSDWIKYLA
jgi:hypothetical protein